MTIILKKGQRLEDVLPKNLPVSQVKKFDEKKYVGMLKLKEDPIVI